MNKGLFCALEIYKGEQQLKSRLYYFLGGEIIPSRDKLQEGSDVSDLFTTANPMFDT